VRPLLCCVVLCGLVGRFGCVKGSSGCMSEGMHVHGPFRGHACAWPIQRACMCMAHACDMLLA
jgi:hypothetical protein